MQSNYCLLDQIQEPDLLDESAKARLSEAVKQLRGDRSQRAFAEELGIGQSTVQQWEAMSGGNPSLENIEKLASARGETPEEFLAYIYGRTMVHRTSLDQVVSDLSMSDLLMLLEKVSSRLNRLHKS